MNLLNRTDFLLLEDLLKLIKQVVAEFLCFFGFVGQELKIRCHLLPDVTDCKPGCLDFGCHPFLLNELSNNDDVDEIIFVSTACECGHVEVRAIRHLDLDLLAFLFLD